MAKEIKIKCVQCGKKGTALISRFRRHIKSDFWYFGHICFIDSGNENIREPYWECPECR